MATQQVNVNTVCRAAHDLRDYQHRFVKIVAEDTVSSVNAATDTVLGVLQTKPLSSEGAGVAILGHTKIISGSDTLAFGDLVGPSETGSAVAQSADRSTGTVGLILSAASSGNPAEMVLFGPSARN